MEQWAGNIAVVAGASSGIGATTAVQLALSGMIVIGLARQTHKIDDLNRQLKNSPYCGQIYSHYCDVTKSDSIKAAFDWIDQEFGHVNVLVNSAGILRINYIFSNVTHQSSEYELQNVINTNLIGSMNVARAAYEIMRRNNDYGHIIQINELWGHTISNILNTLYFHNSYTVSKFGITAMLDTMKRELGEMCGNKVKLTDISPGWTRTNLVKSAGYPNDAEFFQKTPHIQPIDVANSVLFALSTPRNVMVNLIKVRAVGELS